MKRLKGMAVLITGGSRGIGPIVAEALAKQGADIALVARSKTGLDEVGRMLFCGFIAKRLQAKCSVPFFILLSKLSSIEGIKKYLEVAG